MEKTAKALWFFGDTLVLSRLRILCLIPIELDPRSLFTARLHVPYATNRDQGSRAGVLCGRSLSKTFDGGTLSKLTLQPIL